MSPAVVIERAIAPLDGLRRQWLAWLTRSPRVTRLLARRDARLSALLALEAGVAFALAVTLPSALFVLGPVLLGVAHVAADVRYLVLRQALARSWQRAVLAACGALIALHVAEDTRLVADAARGEIVLVALWVVAGVLVAARESGAWPRGLAALAASTALAVPAVYHPQTARLVFVHAHNVVALVLWLVLFRARVRALLVPLLALAAAVLVLASGVCYRVPFLLGVPSAFHLHVVQAADWLAPGLSVERGVGLTMAFVFLQSIHYAVWLSFIPQDQTAAQGTLTFRMSFRSLCGDFGAFGLVLVALAALAVVLGACWAPLRARSLYVSLATFHGYLELALLAHLWVRRGRAPRAVPAPS